MTYSLSIQRRINPEGGETVMVSLDGYGIGCLSQVGGKWRLLSTAPGSPVGEWTDTESEGVGRLVGHWLGRFQSREQVSEWIRSVQAVAS